MKPNPLFPKFTTSEILFAIFVWGLFILRLGYRFGTGDQVEYLPYALYLGDHSLYLHDLFVQGLSQKVPNERSIVCYILLPFLNHLALACFILHAFFTLLLILGLERLGKLLTGNALLTRVAILVNFFLLYDRGLGNVELYSDVFQGSAMGVAVAVWALYYFFREKYLAATMLSSLATILHPVEGLTVYLVISGVFCFYMIVLRQISITAWLKYTGIYTLTAGVFLAFFFVGKMDGLNTLTGHFDKETFFSIYFEFRHPHHYIFRHFPFSDKLFFLLWTFINLWYGYVHNRKLFWFNLIAVSGVLIYLVCTDYLHQIDIAGLQFYKITQWMKFFAVLVIVKYVAGLTNINWENLVSKRNSLILSAICVAIVGIILVVKPGWMDRPGVYHQYGNEWKQKDDMVAISLQIDTQVDKQAVFIQPFSCTELKYFGRVSSWVDWKAFLKNRNSIFEWYRRIKMVYGITIDDKEKGFALKDKAENFFFNLNEASTNQLKAEGVTHIVTANKHWPNGTLLFQNNTYAVYKL